MTFIRDDAAMTGTKDKSKSRIEGDLDALFKLPLAEFTAARNALAARLKQAGSNAEAQQVKALVKPSVSAWAVNQLYWKHRAEFENLIAAGERLGRAHAAQLSGKGADTTGPLAARREALAVLARLAAQALRDSGHNASPDTMRRIATTLEALSTYSPLAHAPSPGRLTDDIDPPGFESLAALLMPGGGRESIRIHPASAPAKATVQNAERALRQARRIAEKMTAALKDAEARAGKAERDRRAAEELFQKAKAAEEDARQRLQSAAAGAERAARTLEEAERGLEEARGRLKGHG
jgi:hypothetical protein